MGLSYYRGHANPDREFIGKGLGNMVAGLFGALPGAGATMGTVVNIRAGGITPVSGALRTLLLLALVLGLGRYVEPIPLAALAGVLMKVGWDIIDWRLLSIVDDSAALVIEQLIEVVRNERTEVIVMGLSGSVAKTLDALEVLRRVPEENVVETLDEVRVAAHALLRHEEPVAE